VAEAEAVCPVCRSGVDWNRCHCGMQIELTPDANLTQSHCSPEGAACTKETTAILKCRLCLLHALFQLLERGLMKAI